MSSGDHISGNVTGDVGGTVAIGRSIAQTRQVGAQEQLASRVIDG